MFAAKNHESSKIKAEKPSTQVNTIGGTAERVQVNPLWNQLAMRVQGKLNIGAPDDPYEREADRVANQVMRMPDQPSSGRPLSFSAVPVPTAQRRCAACEEEEKLQRKETGSAVGTSATAPPIVHDALRTRGEPLDPATRGYFEPRFGGKRCPIFSGKESLFLPAK